MKRNRDRVQPPIPLCVIEGLNDLLPQSGSEKEKRPASLKGLWRGA